MSRFGQLFLRMLSVTCVWFHFYLIQVIYSLQIFDVWPITFEQSSVLSDSTLSKTIFHKPYNRATLKRTLVEFIKIALENST